MKGNKNNSLEVTDIVKSITNSLCGLVTEDDLIEDDFTDIFYELLLWKCKNKAESLTSCRLDDESMKNFLVVDNKGEMVIDRGMILSGISLSSNPNGFDVALFDKEGGIYSSKEAKLFIACTATNCIHIGDDNIQLISEYVSVRHLVNPNGRFKCYPRKLKPKKLLLSFLSSTFDKRKVYTEIQVNSHLKHFYNDFALIRRDLVDYGFMKRERNGSEYQIKHA